MKISWDCAGRAMIVALFVSGASEVLPPVSSEPTPLAVSGPIFLSGNDELATSPLVGRGDGSEERPFVIEDIRFAVFQYGLWIHNVSAHVLVTRNVFDGATEDWAGAINITQSSNISLTSNRIFAHRGISVAGSTEIEISNNSLRSPPLLPSRGISVMDSLQVGIRGNQIRVEATGIEVERTRGINIGENFVQITGSMSAGIAFWDSAHEALLSNNRLLGPRAGVGFVMEEGSDVVFSDNEAFYWTNAVVITSKDYDPDLRVLVEGNRLRWNYNAIHVHECVGCVVTTNKVLDNQIGLDLGTLGEVSCNEFERNEWAVHGGNASFRNNTFVQNDLHVVNRDYPSVDMRWNWWGSDAGPAAEHLEGPVAFGPWLYGPPVHC